MKKLKEMIEAGAALKTEDGRIDAIDRVLAYAVKKHNGDYVRAMRDVMGASDLVVLYRHNIWYKVDV